CRLPLVVVVARQYLGRMRIRLPGGGGPPQEGFRFGVASATQQQFAEGGEGWRPIRIEFAGVPQDSFRARRIAQHQRDATEQPLRLGIVGMGFNDAPELSVSRAKIAGLQQAVDALHRSVERNRNHVSRRTVRPAPIKCSRRPALSLRATVYASYYLVRIALQPRLAAGIAVDGDVEMLAAERDVRERQRFPFGRQHGRISLD